MAKVRISIIFLLLFFLKSGLVYGAEKLETSWSYKDWSSYSSSNDDQLGYFTLGEQSVNNLLAFSLYKNSSTCKNHFMRLVLNSKEDIPINTLLTFNVGIDKMEPRSLKAEIANSRYISPKRYIITIIFPYFLDLNFENLKKGYKLKFEVDESKKIKDKFYESQETFSLYGFTAHNLHVEESCNKSDFLTKIQIGSNENNAYLNKNKNTEYDLQTSSKNTEKISVLSVLIVIILFIVIIVILSRKKRPTSQEFEQARESYNEEKNYDEDTSDNQVSETVRDSKFEEVNTERRNIDANLDKRTSLNEQREVKVSSSVKVESFLIDD